MSARRISDLPSEPAGAWLAPLSVMKRSLVLLFALCACGGTSTDPGGGTQTLLVNGSVELQDGGSSFFVEVRKGSIRITGAAVSFESGLGTTTLVGDAEGRYQGFASGWASSYHLRVVAGDDNLDATILAPEAPSLVEPEPSVAFDPHLAENGIVRLSWSGEAAQTIEVGTKDFKWGPNPDGGGVDVPATAFQDTTQQVRIERKNETPLAGGTAGSQLEARADTRTDLTIVNPF